MNWIFLQSIHNLNKCTSTENIKRWTGDDSSMWLDEDSQAQFEKIKIEMYLNSFIRKLQKISVQAEKKRRSLWKNPITISGLLSVKNIA